MDKTLKIKTCLSLAAKGSCLLPFKILHKTNISLLDLTASLKDLKSFFYYCKYHLINLKLRQNRELKAQ